ncbi:glycohydrolase toxin TNT-related protein [Poriferisphaera corsica]|uniref:glycohydrolase toxin TNT-related protein n=1 Tax=Poriferisphaera corsica TaxID=2528020 RepID=UPI0036F2A9DD
MLQPSYRVDRYGYREGKFVSPLETPFEYRALPHYKINDPYEFSSLLNHMKWIQD